MCHIFFVTDSASAEIYTLSLHDALPISSPGSPRGRPHRASNRGLSSSSDGRRRPVRARSEEHTSELQSRVDLVCRLLLEKKKTIRNTHMKGSYIKHSLL